MTTKGEEKVEDTLLAHGDDRGDFEKLLEELGGDGKYQIIVLALLIIPLSYLGECTFMVNLFTSYTPDHWCTPPDSHLRLFQEANYTLDRWKADFLPREIGPDKRPRPSQCFMYQVDNWTVIRDVADGKMRLSDEDWPQISCPDFSYDQTDFSATAISQNDWVCWPMKQFDASTTTLSVLVLGAILGTIVFSMVADRKGRRFNIMLCLFMLCIFSVIRLIIPVRWYGYVGFSVMTVLSIWGSIPLEQSAMNIIGEMSTSKFRGVNLCSNFIACCMGSAVLPLIAWLVRDWQLICLVAVIPAFPLILASYFYLPESARWQIAKGKLAGATSTIRRIAQVNGKVVPRDLETRLLHCKAASNKPSHGYRSLFQGKVLALRTVLITCCLAVASFIYYQLTLNTVNMAGDFFLNFFLVNIVTTPGTLLGGLLSNYAGRRFTQFGFYVILCIVLVVLIFITNDPEMTTVTMVLCIVARTCVTACFVCIYIQVS